MSGVGARLSDAKQGGFAKSMLTLTGDIAEGRGKRTCKDKQPTQKNKCGLGTPDRRGSNIQNAAIAFCWCIVLGSV